MIGLVTITIIAVLGALSPGPDFIIVSRNAIGHHRRAGIFSSLGVGTGIIIHCTYCILGLALIVAQSLVLFTIMRYTGAAYLLYLGGRLLFSRTTGEVDPLSASKAKISGWQAYRDGLLVNLLNPKCIIFLLAIFTSLIKPQTSYHLQFVYAFDLAIITTLWFVLLAVILSYHPVRQRLLKVQKVVNKLMGCFLIFFAIDLLIK